LKKAPQKRGSIKFRSWTWTKNKIDKIVFLECRNRKKPPGDETTDLQHETNKTRCLTQKETDQVLHHERSEMGFCKKMQQKKVKEVKLLKLGQK